MNRFITRALIALAGSVGVVHAQTVITRNNASIPLSFYDGVIHPLTVTHHLLALLAMGLLAGRQLQSNLDRALFTGLGGVALGMIFAPQTELSYVLPLMLTLSTIAALAIIIDKASHQWFALPVIGVTCLALGLDTPADPNMDFSHQAATWAGVLLGASAPLIYPALITRNARNGWQLVAVRIAASWLSAVALVVLVLKLVGK